MDAHGFWANIGHGRGTRLLGAERTGGGGGAARARARGAFEARHLTSRGGRDAARHEVERMHVSTLRGATASEQQSSEERVVFEKTGCDLGLVVDAERRAAAERPKDGA